MWGICVGEKLSISSNCARIETTDEHGTSKETADERDERRSLFSLSVSIPFICVYLRIQVHLCSSVVPDRPSAFRHTIAPVMNRQRKIFRSALVADGTEIRRASCRERV